MKIHFLLFLLTPFAQVIAQSSTSYGSFKVQDQEIVFQKVFADPAVTAQKLAEFYKSKDYVSELSADGDQITFRVNELIVDYKKFQFSQVSVPPVIQTGKYSGLVSVDVKDGRYRVTVRDIQFTGDLGYRKVTTRDRLTAFACRDNGTSLGQDWCKPNTLGLLEKAFTDKLQMPAGEGEDW